MVARWERFEQNEIVQFKRHNSEGGMAFGKKGEYYRVHTRSSEHGSTLYVIVKGRPCFTWKRDIMKPAPYDPNQECEEDCV